MNSSKFFKIISVGVLALALVVFTGGVANAVVTIDATSVISSAALTLTGAATSVWSLSTGALTIDSGTTSALNFGTAAAAKTITIGNAASTLLDLDAISIDIDGAATGVTIDALDAGTLNIGTSADAASDTSAINIGTSATARTITVGNAASTILDLNAISVDIDGAATGVTIDALDAGSINLGTSADAASDTSAINIGTSATARTITLGGGSASNFVVNGRLSTGSVAGSAVTLGSTYTQTEGVELRYTVTDWTGIGATNTFTGLYLRPQVNTAAAAGNLKGIEVNTTNNGVALGSMHGAYLETQVKAIAANATVGPIYGIESQISLYAPTAGTLTLTEQTDVGVAAGRFQLGLNSGLADYTSVYGVLIQTNDGSVGSRTLGSGLLIRNFPVEGTQTWTKAIQVTAPAVTGLSLEGAMTTGIDIAGASTTDIKLQNDETIDNAVDGQFLFSRNTDAGVTIMAADSASPANLTIDTTGAGTITVGSADVTVVTITSAATDAGLVLPLTSVGAGEIVTDTITATQLNAALTFAALDFVDLALVVHNTTANQGLRLPQAASATPSSPTSGEGYIAWNVAGNQVIAYDGSAWITAIGNTTAANTWTDNQIYTFAGDEDIAITSTATTTTVVPIVANSLTTGIGESIASTATAITDTGRLFYVNHGGATSTAGILSEFTTAATDETVVLRVSSAAMIDGVNLSVVGTTGMTTGSLIRATTSTAALVATNGIVSIRGTGAHTSTANAGLLDVQSSGLVGTAANGTLVNFQTTAAAQVDTTVLNVENSGFTTGYTGSMLRIKSVTTTGAARVVDLIADGITSDGTAMKISTAALTTGDGLLITNGTSAITTGSLLNVTAGGTGAIATDGVVKLSHAGVYTSTSNAGFVNITANATTAGTVLAVNATGLVDGVGIYSPSAEAGLTTGKYLSLGGVFTVAKYGATVITGTAEGTAALTLTTGDVVISDGDLTIAGGQIEVPDNATSFAFLIDDTGGAAYVTLVTTNGAETMVFGHGTVDSVTVTTDGSGTAEVALPAGSIDSTEILDATILEADIAASSATGLGVLRTARAKYDFAVDGGVAGAITPASTAVLPDNAVMVGATINSTTAVTSVGAATLAVGTTAGSSATAILGATAKASLTIDALINGVPVFSTPVKMTAAGSINVTVGTADLTAGVVEITVFYYVAAN